MCLRQAQGPIQTLLDECADDQRRPVVRNRCSGKKSEVLIRRLVGCALNRVMLMTNKYTSGHLLIDLQLLRPICTVFIGDITHIDLTQLWKL